MPYVLRRRFAWLAVLAILLNALTPAVAHAMAARLGFIWLEICTQDGLKRVAVRYTGVRPDIPPGAHVADHDCCVDCAPAGLTFAHVPPARTLAPLLAGPDVPAAACAAAVPQLVAWTGSHARAPPSFS